MEGAMRFERYSDALGDCRWHLLADNGNIIADSGEGYRNLADCDHAISLVQSSRDARIEFQLIPRDDRLRVP
jgi:uncharacterized protein YegP (UPF0339 family)